MFRIITAFTFLVMRTGDNNMFVYKHTETIEDVKK